MKSDSSRRHWVALAGGPVAALAVYFTLPHEGLPDPARVTAALGVLMAVWWMTEAIPLAATALLPLVFLPTAGIYPTGEGLPPAIRHVAAPYGSEFIFLFLGGFLIAIAIEKWNLHRRFALLTILAVGTRPTRLIAGFMLATAALSMWISNTACTVLMLPIALSVISLVEERLGEEARGSVVSFATCLLIALAYAASIGGVATLVGTPPNVFLAGYLQDAFGEELSFGRWFVAIAPMSAILLFVAWILLTRLIFPVRVGEIPGGREMIRTELRKLGPLSRGEAIALAVFLSTAALWILRKPLASWPAFAELFPWWRHVHDAGIAMFGALLLFVLPVDPRRRIFTLDWQSTSRVPWGVLLLFGGGLSLARAVSESGLAAWIGAQLPESGSLLLLVIVATTVIVLLTELSSNLATVTVFLPILGSFAAAKDINPLWIVVPASIAASCAFMLPVATPPNAIVFGSGKIRIRDMARAGAWMNGVSVVVVIAYFWLVGSRILGIE